MLDDVRTNLRDTETQLWAKINDPKTSPEIRKTLRDEYTDVNHRSQILLGKELVGATSSLQAKADKVKKSRGELQQVLENIQSAIEVTQQLTQFLAAVDDFIKAAEGFLK